MKLGIEEVARISGGSLIGNSQELVTGVKIDSRNIVNGDLFVAIKGEFLDGHSFVESAFRDGAVTALVERPVEKASGPVIVVSNVEEALVKLASFVRDSIDPIVVGITGSTGKTTTRDLLSSIARGKFSTVASEKNYNNELGVPLTLLRTAQETELVICEMGARGKGHIKHLCQIARPQVGIVTNVGVTHYEMFGSKDEIASSKSELPSSIPETGAVILNADDPLVLAMTKSTNANIITFGTSPTADIRVGGVRVDSWGRPRFTLEYQNESVNVELLISGTHQPSNAAAAASAGIALGLDLQQCKEGLQRASITPMRMQVVEVGGTVIINDSYNSSPPAVVSAVETARKMAIPPKRVIAVLGYMAELGDIEEFAHREIGKMSSGLIDHLIVVGEKASQIADSAREEGHSNVDRVRDAEEAARLLLSSADVLGPGDVLLVKGSRVAGLEKVVEQVIGGLQSR